MAESVQPAEAGSSFLKSARDIAFIIAIYLYFAGWVYIYTYFSAFGISIGQAGLEFYYFIVYSVNVISFLVIDHWFYSLLATMIFIILIYKIKWSWFPYASCIALFGLLYYCAILAGISDARKDFAYRGSGLLRIKFVMKEEIKKDKNAVVIGVRDSTKSISSNKDKTKKEPITAKAVEASPDDDVIPENIDSTFTANNKKENLRLLLNSKEVYVVIVADRSVTFDNAFEKDKKIFTVKKEDVKLSRIIR
ncbi:hypothetical protein DIU31_028255 [Mucilaginibacter rubeus]|uniref:Uncharacterized protein n=1 Tax=Mucilaginibacter rubeus TaxID=2027860 RepID=A0AAE6JKW3_9SPHI|nr:MULTISPECIES: hypothetical protein [Mucilaginibacter]QEM07201.1 hypothetical protein DIU31_028255 [Mucilaginibacter rubeus]QEM19657.1 hypothetical protein DIU38_027830 [Mucilaginibacter gossypii]QTE43647.1 hypothetical protein J3L19_32800 [Mucilaginibacter rubeus]QTE50247.1 hypothetical protein J3L21_32755 [Mucilaginibacter rubeus]QTE55335.1 hypothetical protein J3L23_24375 [Mucilaginibacter rubeus]